MQENTVQQEATEGKSKHFMDIARSEVGMEVPRKSKSQIQGHYGLAELSPLFVTSF